MIKWEKLTKQDVEKVKKIVDRIMDYQEDVGLKRSRMDWHMDIEAAHINCKLDLDRLLSFDDGNFGHDVFGIMRHLNRNTGALMDCFLPRCATH